MKPMLNLGCGRVILPGEKQNHHALVDDTIYRYPHWVNVDKNPEPGVDKVIDLFRYPWDLEDNAYSGALISHVCEHIPHEIQMFNIENPNLKGLPIYSTSQIGAAIGYEKQKLFDDVEQRVKLSNEWDEYQANIPEMQDGWFAFFSELWRVLEDGAMVHIIAPYGKTDDAISDPTHTRYLNEYQFRHSMEPNPDAPFKYNHKLHFKVLEDDRYRPTPDFARPPYFVAQTMASGEVVNVPTEAFWWAKKTMWNVVHDFYVRMVAVKS